MEALVRELAGLVRAALRGWPETIRLCLMLTVVAALVVIARQLVL
jgi:hypothetical protein